MKSFFKIIAFPFKLIFTNIYLIYNWLLNNSIGYLITKNYTTYSSKEKITNKAWFYVKKIINIIVLLIIIFSFEFIYKYSLGIVFTFIFEMLGKFLALSIFNGFFASFSKILTVYGVKFSQGISTTLYLSLIGTTIGLIVALFFSYLLTLKINRTDSKFVRLFKKIIQKIINIYITIVRGTPMMVQAMIIYWGISRIISWDPKVASLVIVSLNTTAYLTEVLKGAILSIDKGQTEGALSLGLTPFQSMMSVVFPQALKNSMASIGNEFVINIKDTAVLSVILVVDIFRVAETAGGSTLDLFTPFIIAALIYLFLTYTVTKILRYLETKLDLPETSLPSSN